MISDVLGIAVPLGILLFFAGAICGFRTRESSDPSRDVNPGQQATGNTCGQQHRDSLTILLAYDQIFHSRVGFWLATQAILLVYALQSSTRYPYILAVLGLLLSGLQWFGTKTLHRRMTAERKRQIVSNPSYSAWYKAVEHDGGGLSMNFLPFLFGATWALILIAEVVNMWEGGPGR